MGMLLIIGNSRVVSDSYRLKLHDDHPTRMTGVLQEPLMNCLQLHPFTRPFVRASPNNSPSVEFGIRGAGALPLALSPLLVVGRWDSDEATLGRLTAIPLHRVTLQEWKFFSFSPSLPAPLRAYLARRRNRQPRKKKIC